MAELADYGIDLDTLRQMYDEWQRGTPKSRLETTYLHKSEPHGKLFSSLVRRYLGHDTERRRPLAEEVGKLREENQRLRQLLVRHGIDPDGPE